MPRTLKFDLDASDLPIGTVLTREYKGEVHEVRVVARAPSTYMTEAARQRGWWRYMWRGRRWKSLSEIAHQITGNRYMSGNRFFKLRRDRR